MPEPVMHKWRERLSQGFWGERVLDHYYEQKFSVNGDPMYQMYGFDRVFEDTSGLQFSVEYKTDFRTAESGNIFFETLSVVTEKKSERGWAYTSKAQLLKYFVPQTGKIYTFRMTDVKEWISRWQRTYHVMEVLNEGYRSFGVVVPIKHLDISGLVAVEENLPRKVVLDHIDSLADDEAQKIRDYWEEHQFEQAPLFR